VTYALRAAAIVFASAVFLQTPARAGTPDFAEFMLATTLAGTGNAGMADGRGSTAEFEGPGGIAYDERGNLYVADGPAQRIRKIDPSGRVTTLAGSGSPVLFGSGAAGGYRDGPSAQAQFDQPGGVAVAADGSIYVADVRNHCIRRITNGTVGTYAGSPLRTGHDDGPVASASFASPRSLDFDRAGNLYVSDPPTGIRRISAAGVVSTLHLPALADAWSVAVYDRGDVSELFVASRLRVTILDLKTERVTATFDTNRPFDSLAPDASIVSDGGEITGPAVSVAPVSATDFVYADSIYSTVRFVQTATGYTRALGEPPLLNAGKVGGSFRDGSNAAFQEPTGVAIGPAGEIAVADTGNRRIRLLSNAAPISNAGFARIFIAADSMLSSNVTRHESIAGVVEDRVCSARIDPSIPCDLEALAVLRGGAQLPAFADAVSQRAREQRPSDVYLFVRTDDMAIASSTPALRALKTGLDEAGVRLVVVLIPDGAMMPGELQYRKIFVGPGDPAAVLRERSAALDATRLAGVNVLDLWPVFFENDARPGFRPLFGAWDDRLTIFGNSLAGDAIARDILRAHAHK
jgi:hypothetical protein